MVLLGVVHLVILQANASQSLKTIGTRSIQAKAQLKRFFRLSCNMRALLTFSHYFKHQCLLILLSTIFTTRDEMSHLGGYIAV